MANKRLTNYILDLGRIIAFHPGLKRITGSTTASILLSQFIYWIDKTTDGWIYKDSYDLEEETSLTYYEQQTARKILVDKGILQEINKRLDHKIAFRINQEKLNDLWEETSGKMSNPRWTKNPEGEKQLSEVSLPIEKPMDLRDFQDPVLHKDHPAHNSAVEKKGDLVDGIIAFANSPGAKKEAIKNEIMDKLESKLHINVTGKNWKDFIEYVYSRQERHSEPVDKFINWLLKNNPNSSYWTPERFQMFYPQAFADDQNKPKEDFVAPLPAREERKIVPMPDDVKKKRNLT